MPVTNTTTGRGYQLPDAANDLSVDVLRIIAAFNAIDVDIVALLSGTTTIAGVKTFSSSPVVPTASPGDNTTKAASTAFVKAAIDAIIASAPGALDTLNELSAALGNDASFAATITAALAGKAASSHSHATGDITGLAAAISAGNVKLAGDVVKVVNTQTGAVATTTTVMPFDDTIPQITEGTEFFTRTITPASATNKLRIDVVFNGSPSTTSYVTVALFKDADANALAVGSHYGVNGEYVQTVFTFFMDAGTTSEITFRVRAGLHTAGTLTMNGDGGARRLGGILFSSITVTEISA